MTASVVSTKNREVLSSNITKFEIFSKQGQSSDVSKGIVRFDYYESILDSTVRLSVTIVDTGASEINVMQKLKLSGFEKVLVEFEDNFKNKLKFDSENPLYVSKIRNVYSHTSRVQFTLDLVTKEFLANEFLATEVYTRYDGSPAEAVSKILKDCLKSKKTLDADPTSNKYNVFGMGKKPLRLCVELGKYSVPSGPKSSAGYFFFQTYDGFKFKSIDKLFDESRGYKSYIYNNTTLLPPEYDGKIIRYTADNTIDVQQNLVMGAYGSLLQTRNPYDEKYKDASKIVSNTDQEELGGLDHPQIGSDFQEFKPYSRRSYKRLDVGQAPSGSVSQQVKKATEENLEVNNVTIQASMRFNQVFTLKLTIFIAGDLSHRAGDLIFCDFPEQSNKKTKGMDKELSGIYMISDICYHVTPERTITKMNLVRDSYGRKPKG